MSHPPPALALLARGGFGGSTRVALRQSILASERGQRVELFCELPIPAEFHPAAVPVHVWGRDPWPLEGGRTADGAGLARLFARHRSDPFQLVQAHFGIPYGELGGQLVQLAREQGLPMPGLVVTLHGSDVLGALGSDELGPAAADQAAVRRFALLQALRGAAVCLPHADLLARARAGDLPLEGALITPNFLCNGDFERPHRERELDRLRVLIAGSLRPVKRPQSALAAALLAADALDGERIALSVDVLGEGSELRACRRLARAGGKRAAVRFGPSRPLTREVWAAYDVLLLASRYESCSLVALEAMARGLPVVAPAVGGLAELLGDAGDRRAWPVAGGLADRELEPALAGALLELARDPLERARRGSRAAEYALRHHGPEVGLEGLDRAAALALGRGPRAG